MKNFLLSILALLCLNLAQGQDNNKATLRQVEDHIEKYMNFSNNYFLTDALSSVVNYKLRIDPKGVIKSREILEPVQHWGHARHLENILDLITSVKGTGKEQVISSSVDYGKYVPAQQRKQITKINDITAPSYNNKQDATEYLCELLNQQARLELFEKGHAKILLRLLHKKDGSIEQAKIKSFYAGKGILKVFSNKELKAAPNNWTAPVVNGKAHDYYKSYIVDLRQTLSPEQVKEIQIARRSKIAEPILMKTEVLPKFRGEDLSYFRSWIMTQLSKKMSSEFDLRNFIDRSIVVSFIVNEDGSAEFERVIRDTICNEQFTELISQIIMESKWTPGTQDGKVVRVKCNIPISFK